MPLTFFRFIVVRTKYKIEHAGYVLISGRFVRTSKAKKKASCEQCISQKTLKEIFISFIYRKASQSQLIDHKAPLNMWLIPTRVISCLLDNVSLLQRIPCNYIIHVLGRVRTYPDTGNLHHFFVTDLSIVSTACLFFFIFLIQLIHIPSCNYTSRQSYNCYAKDR